MFQWWIWPHHSNWPEKQVIFKAMVKQGLDLTGRADAWRGAIRLTQKSRMNGEHGWGFFPYIRFYFRPLPEESALLIPFPLGLHDMEQVQTQARWVCFWQEDLIQLLAKHQCPWSDLNLFYQHGLSEDVGMLSFHTPQAQQLYGWILAGAGVDKSLWPDIPLPAQDGMLTQTLLEAIPLKPQTLTQLLDWDPPSQDQIQVMDTWMNSNLYQKAFSYLRDSSGFDRTDLQSVFASHVLQRLTSQKGRFDGAHPSKPIKRL